MTTDFQLSLLCYLVQSTDGVNYIGSINEEVFDVAEHKLTIQSLKRYFKNKGKLPGKLAYRDFLDREIINTANVSDALASSLRRIGDQIFVPLSDADLQYIGDQFALAIQEKQIDSTFQKYAQGDIGTQELFTQMFSISSTFHSENDEDEYKDSGFLVRDRDKHFHDHIEGNPCFLEDLNNLTAAGGFYSPQLIVLMSGPKHFKTGLLIKMGIEYARNGFSVYYADGENGARSVRNRSKMAIMECELAEIFDPALRDEIDKTLWWFGKSMGGDFFVDSFPAGVKSINDIAMRLDYLKKEFDFAPNIIIYDSIDHFVPNNEADRRRDPRIQIQRVYHEAIALNKRRNMFAFAPSQVNRSAVDKKTFDMKDISEDFGKVFNAHAIFAICGTPEEKERGVRRIVPVAQREGEKFNGHNLCMIQIDESRMVIQEVDRDKLMEDITDD